MIVIVLKIQSYFLLSKVKKPKLDKKKEFEFKKKNDIIKKMGKTFKAIYFSKHVHFNLGAVYIQAVVIAQRSRLQADTT